VVDSTKPTLLPLYGALQGILVSDRATALTFWAMERRQICLAHLVYIARREAEIVIVSRRGARLDHSKWESLGQESRGFGMQQRMLF
jgi:hypothetical protein